MKEVRAGIQLLLFFFTIIKFTIIITIYFFMFHIVPSKERSQSALHNTNIYMQLHNKTSCQVRFKRTK